MKDFAVRYSDAWSSQNPERVASFFSASGSLRVNDGTALVGRKALAEFARGFMTTFPDLNVQLNNLVIKADSVEYHWILTGTDRATRRKVRISGFEEWRFSDDGLILESLGHYDENEYRRQLEGA